MKNTTDKERKSMMLQMARMIFYDGKTLSGAKKVLMKQTGLSRRRIEYAQDRFFETCMCEMRREKNQGKLGRKNIIPRQTEESLSKHRNDIDAFIPRAEAWADQTMARATSLLADRDIFPNEYQRAAIWSHAYHSRMRELCAYRGLRAF
jgi:hypothetical protein